MTWVLCYSSGYGITWSLIIIYLQQVRYIKYHTCTYYLTCINLSVMIYTDHYVQIHVYVYMYVMLPINVYPTIHISRYVCVYTHIHKYVYTCIQLIICHWRVHMFVTTYGYTTSKIRSNIHVYISVYCICE